MYDIAKLMTCSVDGLTKCGGVVQIVADFFCSFQTPTANPAFVTTSNDDCQPMNGQVLVLEPFYLCIRSYKRAGVLCWHRETKLDGLAPCPATRDNNSNEIEPEIRYIFLQFS